MLISEIIKYLESHKSEEKDKEAKQALDKENIFTKDITSFQNAKKLLSVDMPEEDKKADKNSQADQGSFGSK